MAISPSSRRDRNQLDLSRLNLNRNQLDLSRLNLKRILEIDTEPRLFSDGSDTVNSNLFRSGKGHAIVNL